MSPELHILPSRPMSSLMTTLSLPAGALDDGDETRELSADSKCAWASWCIG